MRAPGREAAGGTPLPPAFDSKIFMREDFDSNRDMELVRVGYIVCRVSPEVGAPWSVPAAGRVRWGYPLPPAFDSKIFLRKDLDSNRDMELVRMGYIPFRMSPEECAHVWCGCIGSFFPTLRPAVRQAPGPVRCCRTRLWALFGPSLIIWAVSNDRGGKGGRIAVRRQ